MNIDQVLAFDVECFLRQLKKAGYSGSMITKVRGMLSSAFKSAEANNLVAKNPVLLAKKMRREPAKKKQAFNADEVRRLMEKLPQTPIGWSIRIMLATGMRKQELLGLEPRHIADDGSTMVWESPKNPGNPVNPSYFDDLFRKALEGIEGVRVLTPHCCRHTYVSQMQALGVNLETIKSIVGHAAVEKFSDAFSG